VLGTVLIAYLPERFRVFGDFRMLVFAAVLVLVMIYRPQGLASLAQMVGLRRSVPDVDAAQDAIVPDQAVQEESHVLR
jgi:hypothetical protein